MLYHEGWSDEAICTWVLFQLTTRNASVSFSMANRAYNLYKAAYWNIKLPYPYTQHVDILGGDVIVGESIFSKTVSSKILIFVLFV